MSKNVVIVAVVAAVVVGYLALRPNEHQRVQREVDELSRHLPRTIGTQVSMTRIELDKKTVKSWYKIDATFETDAETTAAVRKVLVKAACADEKFRTVIAKGYDFDNFVDVQTPHGPGQFHILISAGDC